MVFYQAAKFGNTIFFETFIKEDFSFGLHLHRCYEFIYLYEGEINISINKITYTLTKNQCAFIQPNNIHSYVSVGHSRLFISIFTPDLIKTFDNLISTKVAVVPYFDCQDFQIHDIVESLIMCSHEDILRIKGNLYCICAAINKNIEFVPQKCNDSNLLNSLLLYIQDNYKDDISLKAMANKLGYDYHYLSRYFNQNIGLTYTSFINNLRINFSAEQLQNTHKAISVIAFESGFSNLRCFNRVFRDILGTTPRDYRQSFLGKSSVATSNML